jgi:hypothetical protein
MNEILVKLVENIEHIGIHSAVLMIQILLNNGANHELIIEPINEKLRNGGGNVQLRKNLTKLLNTKSYPSKQRQYHDKYNHQLIQPVQPVQPVHQQKSQYTETEEIQLRKFANRFGIRFRDTNHLSLKIINHLLKEQ